MQQTSSISKPNYKKRVRLPTWLRLSIVMCLGVLIGLSAYYLLGKMGY